MLLVYHIDKNESAIENFLDEELRLNLGFFPKQNTRVKLKMVGFSNDTEGGIVYLRFPDLISGELSEENEDFTNVFSAPGIAIGADEGDFNGIDIDLGRYGGQSDTRVFDLDLGRMDTQKDYFTVVVNARRGSNDLGFDRINLNNFSCVLTMENGHEMM